MSNGMVKEVIWRGAWLMVRLKDESLKEKFLNSWVKIFSKDRLQVFGQARDLWDQEAKNALMLDVSQTIGAGSIPDKIEIKTLDETFILPIVLFGEEEDPQALAKAARQPLFPEQKELV